MTTLDELREKLERELAECIRFEEAMQRADRQARIPVHHGGDFRYANARAMRLIRERLSALEKESAE